MALKKTDDDHFETIVVQLADSVLGLSDEATLDETEEAGADPDEEAERTRQVLRMASQAWELDAQSTGDIERMSPRRKASSLNR